MKRLLALTFLLTFLIPQTTLAEGAITRSRVTLIETGGSTGLFSGGVSCAIRDELLYCWGEGMEGRLGIDLGYTTFYYGQNQPTIKTLAINPVPMSSASLLAGKKISVLSVGRRHSCAVADGVAYCWGRYFYGALGVDWEKPLTNRGFEEIAPLPKPVSVRGPLSGKKVTDISVGEEHTCAIADGAAYCWGQSYEGQLGDGAPGFDVISKSPEADGYSITPVAVSTQGVLAGKKLTAISAGAAHTCALGDGVVYCWGQNGSGQLGIPRQKSAGNSQASSDTFSNLPVEVSTQRVLAGKKVTSISAGAAHTCAIANDAAYCWGDNSSGQLGLGRQKSLSGGESSDVPMKVASEKNGLLGKKVTSISAGEDHTCVVADLAAYCWGSNVYGRNGDGSVEPTDTPTKVFTKGVLAGKKVTSISASEHTCVIADGAAFCWGPDTGGNLGNILFKNSKVPVAVQFADGKVKNSTLVCLDPSSTESEFKLTLIGIKPKCPMGLKAKK